jgi:hypothetical protein
MILCVGCNPPTDSSIFPEHTVVVSIIGGGNGAIQSNLGPADCFNATECTFRISDAGGGGAYTVSITASPRFIHTEWRGDCANATAGQPCTQTWSAGDRIDSIIAKVQPEYEVELPPPVVLLEGAIAVVPIRAHRAPGFTAPITWIANYHGQRTAITSAPSPRAGVDEWHLTIDATNVRAGSSPAALAPTPLPAGLVVGTFLQLPVTVVAPQSDFAVSALPGTIDIIRGGSATAAISLTRVGSQVDTIHLRDVGRPAGVVATFSPNVLVGATSVLDIIADTAIAAGLYPFEVEASWKSITRRTTLTLNVVDPDYKLVATPSVLTIPRGASSSFLLNVNRISAVIKDVTLSKQNEAPGIVAKFPTGTTTHREAGPGTNVDVSVAATVQRGTYRFQIQGVALGVTRSADVTVNVIDPPITATLAPATLTIAAGTAGQTLLAIGGLGYMQSGVTVRVPGPLPAGIGVTVSPLPTSFSNFVVDATAAPGTRAGTYQIPIQVIHLGVTYIVTLSLTIS